MIEVEKKCVATTEFMDFLKTHADKLGEKVCEDIYWDFKNLRLIKNDIWLRERNGRRELKFPMAVEGKKSDVYEEIENDEGILAKLNLKNFDELEELVVLVTRRQKFQIGDFHIDVDEVTSPGRKFSYNLMEIELMVESAAEYEAAQRKILQFMREHLLKEEVVNGKIVEYFRLYRRDIFELFKTNPHHAHRVVG